jgi:hypothetical protein
MVVANSRISCADYNFLRCCSPGFLIVIQRVSPFRYPCCLVNYFLERFGDEFRIEANDSNAYSEH